MKLTIRVIALVALFVLLLPSVCSDASSARVIDMVDLSEFLYESPRISTDIQINDPYQEYYRNEPDTANFEDWVVARSISGFSINGLDYVFEGYENHGDMQTYLCTQQMKNLVLR